MTAPLLEAKNLMKRYGNNVALNNVNLTVHAGRTHALVGRNGAGKSTLVSLITGLNKADSGTIQFNGVDAPAAGDLHEWRKHVACVYQKSTIIPHLSVAENLLINRQNLDKKLISWKNVYQNAQNILDEWDIPVDVRAEAGSLNVENRQLMEIARSLSYGARFIILDEPTAMLDGRAIKRLFARMEKLHNQGVTFLFISHHLSEVYDICQDVTVYRDAKHILTTSVAELPKNQLIEAMTGEKYTEKHYSSRELSPEITLNIHQLNQANAYENISFHIKKGEMVGLAGGGGCGKTELAETLVGLRECESGEILLKNKTYPAGNVKAALNAGIGFVPQDRHHEGFIPDLSIAENATLSIMEKLGKWGLIKRSKQNTLAQQWFKELDIKAYGIEQPVSGLSGGNQQKVVQARAMANNPDLLVMMSPTAGVDIKSKETLLDYVAKSSEKGTSVLIVSDELDDLRACDRVLVMYHGKLTHEFPIGWQDQELIAAMEGLSEPQNPFQAA
ncbi:sugar ABC transporter ATP-binding protein [Alysiella filiformis]|uniref:Simple sugar transport system ATP-binding protein n=1 Tax=Alysiella filiformis DSM 16848 TaxID=1120981 RepID=A0A286E1L4_9NEIS|nr:sugar ABC transporter ATP-binding protein [Alysiella filiformis]QMT30766.1 sugar ABC transporter ATP-binding protein [Alysiella filiformis]UBQ56254.1 sugar ABC transporter ATP-binding protein [Alysiella filiformis DSM 16848]SOD64797.1 simple sugar transport system ATP-binding protein [Alysiella filiformis DSM 16848]